jgi:hypothetical protein
VTLYERIHNTVEAEQWDGTPECLERLVHFVGDRYVRPGADGVLRGVAALEDGPVLRFYCAQAETIVSLRVGGAVAAERDGSGFYPIAPDVLAEQFRPVTDPSPTADDDDDTLTDDELADALALDHAPRTTSPGRPVNWYRRGATIRLGGAAIIGTLLILGLGGWWALLTLAVAIGIVAARHRVRGPPPEGPTVSNRAKVKLTKLGRRRVDAFYPVVYDGTDQDATTRALAEAAVKLRHLTGAWRVGPVEWRRYLGYAAVVEVLTYLANIGAVPADGRHAALLDEALRLGDRATSRCRASKCWPPASPPRPAASPRQDTRRSRERHPLLDARRGRSDPLRRPRRARHPRGHRRPGTPRGPLLPASPGAARRGADPLHRGPRADDPRRGAPPVRERTAPMTTYAGTHRLEDAVRHNPLPLSQLAIRARIADHRVRLAAWTELHHDGLHDLHRGRSFIGAGRDQWARDRMLKAVGPAAAPPSTRPARPSREREGVAEPARQAAPRGGGDPGTFDVPAGGVPPRQACRRGAHPSR